MDANMLVRSKFMVSREFGTGDIPKEPMPTIASVTKPSEDDEMTKDWWLVTFKEAWAKPLKVNTTHQQALILMFGSETDHWIGKRIGLYAMAGTFFKKRQTAVRIKGSPDLKEAKSFSVKKWGGGRDTYNLVPMGGAPTNGTSKAAAPPAPFIPDGTVRIGPHKSAQIVTLTPAELAATIALGKEQIAKAPTAAWVPNAQAHVAELEADEVRRAKLEEQMASGAPPPGAAEDAPF